MNLFFSTQVSINVNGFLTKPFQARRGLRQGNPLSSLLFNLAFDPFLRLINQDTSFQGFNFAPPQFVEPPPPQPSYSNIPSASTPPAVKALAYADDVLVLLSSFRDFDRLQAAISTYAAASNAHFNYNKTQAFSLSGATLPDWQQFLTDHHISTWHDAQSLSPLRYLGYPVYSSLQQRNVFMEQLITSISNACNIHSQRQLSIRGRTTVLNSLILSRLWHVLRLVPLAKPQLSRIRSISSRFLNGGSFPRISYATLILPRTAGGLKLLDPESQYKALQWRWLLHLLQPLGIECTVTDFPLPSIPYCKYLLQLQSAAPDDLPSSYIWPLLFPSFRSSYLSTKSLHSFSTLFKSIDSIAPSSFDDIVLSPTTYLCLPLSLIISPSCTSSPLPRIFSSRTFKKLIGSHILRLDPVNHHLRFRHFTSTEIFHYSRTSKQVINLLSIGTIQLCSTLSSILTNTTLNSASAPFNLSPIISRIFGSPSFTAIPSRLLVLSPKAYKYFYRLHNPVTLRASRDPPPRHSLSHAPILPARAWLELWSAKIPHLSRTIWYKILHRRIPHLGFLHHVAPAKYTTNICPLCSIEPDSLLHFFFTCPAVSSVWSLVAPKYFAPQWTSHIYFFLKDYSSAVIYMRPMPPRDLSLPDAPSLSSFQLVACVLQAIWTCRWQFLFHDTPFTANYVFACAERLINRFDSIVAPW